MSKIPKNELDRIVLTRLVSQPDRPWDFISNPRWDYFTKALSAVLDNAFNSYAEYENCGVVYRMVRRKDLTEYLTKYGMDPDVVPGLSLLDRDK